MFFGALSFGTMIKASLRLLRALTLFAATVALVAQAIAVTSNAWLYSIELMSNPKYNGTGDKEHLEKRTVSGLWRLCYNTPGKIIMKCENIDYFPNEEYSPDPNDSTMAIPYAVKRAAAFIFMSCIILMLGFLLCILGSICPKRPVISFASGIAYILSGLLVLTGMVIYISTFKSEVGNKLRPRSSFQGPMFRYHYGYSFILAVCALMMSELAGTFTIFLFIHWHKTDIKKRQSSLRHHHHHQHHHNKYAEFSPTGAEDHIACRRHSRGSSSSGRRNSKARDSSSGELSPCASTSRGGMMRRTVHTSIPTSESMRDLAYYNLPPFSRDTTCNTVSTSADINREYSREFSFEILRRTTPV